MSSTKNEPILTKRISNNIGSKKMKSFLPRRSGSDRNEISKNTENLNSTTIPKRSSIFTSRRSLLAGELAPMTSTTSPRRMRILRRTNSHDSNFKNTKNNYHTNNNREYDDSGSVSSISTAPSFFHPRIYSHEFQNRHQSFRSSSSVHSVSSQSSTSKQLLVVEALERAAAAGNDTNNTHHNTTVKPYGAKLLKKKKKKGEVEDFMYSSSEEFILKTNPKQLQQKDQQQHHRVPSPIPDIYVFRRINYDSSSSTEHSRGGSSTNTVTPTTTTSTSSASPAGLYWFPPSTTANSTANTSITILLLSPSSPNIFEFVTIPYSTPMTVQQILQNYIPNKGQTYVGLCRRTSRPIIGTIEDSNDERGDELEEDFVERFHLHHRLPLPFTSNFPNPNCEEDDDDFLHHQDTFIDSSTSTTTRSHINAKSFFIAILPNYSVSECLTRSDSILAATSSSMAPNQKAYDAAKPLGWKTDTNCYPLHNPQRHVPSIYSFTSIVWIIIAAAFGIVLSCFALALNKHWKLTSPLRPGDTMHQGEIRSKCGIFHRKSFSTNRWIIPFCQTTALQLSSNGKLTYYHNNQVLWEIQPIEVESAVATTMKKNPWWKGGKSKLHDLADPNISHSNTTVQPFSSLYVDFNGKIFINGMKTYIKRYDITGRKVDKNDGKNAHHHSLVPWPFVLDPNYA